MSAAPLAAVRAPARDRPRANTLQRERHEPEYGILVATVALAAIGILMVYSSSAIKSFLQRDDPFAIVGPQILWASLGIVAMLVMMRVDYRWLRVASVPMFLVGVAGLLLVFIPRDQHRGRRLGALAQDRAAAGGPPGRVHEARARRLPRALVRQAGERRSAGCWRARVPFLVIVVPVVVLVLLEPDLGTSSVLAFTAFTMFFLAGANLLHLVGASRLAAVPTVALMFLQRLPDGPDHGLAGPVGRPGRASASTASRATSRSRSAGVFGAGLGESRLAGGLFLPNAFNDFIFAIVGEEFGLLGGGLVIVLFLAFGYLGIRTSPRGARHVRGAARGRDHGLDLPPGVHQHRGRGRAHPGHRHPAAVRVGGRVVPDHQLRGGRHPAVGLARDGRERNVERCAC